MTINVSQNKINQISPIGYLGDLCVIFLNVKAIITNFNFRIGAEKITKTFLRKYALNNLV